MDETYRLWFLVIPLVIVGGFAGFQYLTVATGTEVRLQTQPVDPRDPFRGNYVDLRYPFSDVTRVQQSYGQMPGLEALNGTESLQYTLEFNPDDDIYGLFEPGDNHYRLAGLYDDRPDLSSEQVCMRATVRHDVHWQWGIESFFAPPGMAQEIEQRRWDGENTTAIVRVDRRCNAVLRALEIGNTTYEAR